MQALIAFAILLTFNAVAIGLGVLSLLPVCIYPFAKRFTWWPQVFLGLAFNWGALLAWTAHTGSLGWPAAVLYLSGIAWTLFYDTIYAHQDAEDDALIGVKSTARLFAERTPLWLRRFLVIAVSLLVLTQMTASCWLRSFAPTGMRAFCLCHFLPLPCSLDCTWTLAVIKPLRGKHFIRLLCVCRRFL